MWSTRTRTREASELSLRWSMLGRYLGLGVLGSVVLALVAILLAPSLGVLLAWTDPQVEVWRHLADTRLATLFLNTAFLLLGVLGFTAVLGVGIAWLNTAFVYPGHVWLQYALVLPLAIPVYVLAFAFLGIFGIGGSLQTQLQTWWPTYTQMDMRSPLVIVLVLGLALFPYVYLLVRNAFLSQGVELLEASRTLGLTRYQSFKRAVLPAIRPALAAALVLVAMETLAEFAAVSIFNYDTFTTAIYKTWFGLFNFSAAAQLASVLLLIALLLPASERLLRGRAHYDDTFHGASRIPRPLHGIYAVLAFTVSFSVFALAFLLPLTQLAFWAWEARAHFDGQYMELLIRTGTLAFMVTAVALPLGLIFVSLSRWRGGRAWLTVVRLLSVGYALPGVVLAAGVVSVVGVITPYAHPTVAWLWQFILPGSLALLVLACLSRFMALGLGALESGLSRIRRPLTEAAVLLGSSRIGVMWRVYLPLIAPAIATSALLIFVETMREMPITLLLRPFGWDTLAVRIFEFSTEGEWARAAPPALVLVALGLVPVFLAMRRQYPVRNRKHSNDYVH